MEKATYPLAMNVSYLHWKEYAFAMRGTVRTVDGAPWNSAILMGLTDRVAPVIALLFQAAIFSYNQSQKCFIYPATMTCTQICAKTKDGLFIVQVPRPQEGACASLDMPRRHQGLSSVLQPRPLSKSQQAQEGSASRFPSHQLCWTAPIPSPTTLMRNTGSSLSEMSSIKETNHCTLSTWNSNSVFNMGHSSSGCTCSQCHSCLASGLAAARLGMGECPASACPRAPMPNPRRENASQSRSEGRSWTETHPPQCLTSASSTRRPLAVLTSWMPWSQNDLWTHCPIRWRPVTQSGKPYKTNWNICCLKWLICHGGNWLNENAATNGSLGSMLYKC